MEEQTSIPTQEEIEAFASNAYAAELEMHTRWLNETIAKREWHMFCNRALAQVPENFRNCASIYTSSAALHFQKLPSAKEVKPTTKFLYDNGFRLSEPPHFEKPSLRYRMTFQKGNSTIELYLSFADGAIKCKLVKTGTKEVDILETVCEEEPNFENESVA